LNRIALLTGDPLSGPDLNAAAPEELREVAGMSDAAVRRIVRAREGEPFRDLADLQARARISEEQARAIATFFVIR
jgi:DNA uptake protein ComE-like DNA-binding protein